MRDDLAVISLRDERVLRIPPGTRRHRRSSACNKVHLDPSPPLATPPPDLTPVPFLQVYPKRHPRIHLSAHRKRLRLRRIWSP
jgi:hypothetical protein